MSDVKQGHDVGKNNQTSQGDKRQSAPSPLSWSSDRNTDATLSDREVDAKVKERITTVNR